MKLVEIVPLVLVGLSSQAFAAGGVRIVNANGAQSFPDIQSAVAAAVDNDVILVAKGTYGGFTIPPTLSLSIVAAPQGAPVTINGTILANPTVQDSVTLSGLTVFGTWGASPALALNSAGGLVQIQDCSFTGSTGDPYTSIGAAPGAWLTHCAGASFERCRFVGATGFYYYLQGGPGASGAWIDSSSASFNGCQFVGGWGGDSEDYGGDGGSGLRAANSSHVHVVGCSLTGGRGGDGTNGFMYVGGNGGDGIQLQTNSTANVLACTLTPGAGGFMNGSAGSPSSGSGVTLLAGGAHRLTATLFNHDEAQIEVTVEGAPGETAFAMASHSLQYAPSAGLNGVLQIPIPSARRPIFLGIIPTSGVLTVYVTRPQLAPSIQCVRYFLQGLFADSTGTRYLSAANFALQFNRDSGPDCDGNGAQDFVDVAVAPLHDCNQSLFPDPCDIVNGTSSDINGNGIPDECEALIWYVQASAPPGGNGTQGAPFQTLQQGIATAMNGQDVLVLDGTYTGPGNRDLNFGGRDIRVRSQNGPANCVIDCQGFGRAFYFSLTNEPASASVSGLTIRNGAADRGAGILIYVSDVTIDRCRFEFCNATQYGGAMDARYSGSRISNCTFAQCTATQAAGALFAYMGGGRQPDVVGCLFANNFAGSAGAMFCEGSHVSHCWFLTNFATDPSQGYGGAIQASGWGITQGVILDDCLFAGNGATRGAGAVHVYGGGSTVSNCTFVDNWASFAGGALRTDPTAGASAPTWIGDCIFWQNSAPSAPQIVVNSYGSSCTISYSDVEGGQAGIVVAGGTLYWGAGNLNSSPAFADPDGPDNDPLTIADNDYRLSLVSPCLDAGDNAATVPDFFDLDGDGITTEPAPVDVLRLPRFVDVPGAPDTGAGNPPLIDIGCFEHP